MRPIWERLILSESLRRLIQERFRRTNYVPVMGMYEEDLEHELRAFVLACCETLVGSGAASVRRYAPGQMLTVRRGDGTWADAEIMGHPEAASPGAAYIHALRYIVAHHPWNHSPLQLPHAQFSQLLVWHMQLLRAQHSHILDTLSGCRLDVLEQCAFIGIAGDGQHAFSDVHDARDLSAKLCELHASLCEGGNLERPPCALLTAGPAAGKTSLLSQVIMGVLDHPSVELVPILIKVQQLQVQLVNQPSEFDKKFNWIDTFLRLQHGPGAYHGVLRQAMMARRALLLVDDLDEGGAKRSEIERHISEVIAPQGHIMIATLRGIHTTRIHRTRFNEFDHLRLLPLTDAQQQ
eukprot:5629374-Prymnesium_polylepis.2